MVEIILEASPAKILIKNLSQNTAFFFVVVVFPLLSYQPNNTFRLRLFRNFRKDRQKIVVERQQGAKEGITHRRLEREKYRLLFNGQLIVRNCIREVIIITRSVALTTTSQAIGIFFLNSLVYFPFFRFRKTEKKKERRICFKFFLLLSLCLLLKVECFWHCMEVLQLFFFCIYSIFFYLFIFINTKKKLQN